MAEDAALIGEPASCADPAVLASCGTPEYRAPEHLHVHAGAIDTWSDVFALGTILFELLTGSRAFPFGAPRGRSLGEEVREYLALPRRLPEAELLACPGVDGALAEILGRATDPEPQRRHVDARALKEDCLRYLYTGQGPAVRSDPLPAAAPPRRLEPDVTAVEAAAGLDEPPTTKAQGLTARGDARVSPERAGSARPASWDDETEASSSFARFFSPGPGAAPSRAPVEAAEAPEWTETERELGVRRWLDAPTLVDAPREGRRRTR
jgi:hypothetical protein